MLENNRLDVTITPVGPGFIGEPDGDKISIRSSSFALTYTIPEPSTYILLAALLAAVGVVRRRGAKQRP